MTATSRNPTRGGAFGPRGTQAFQLVNLFTRPSRELQLLALEKRPVLKQFSRQRGNLHGGGLAEIMRR